MFPELKKGQDDPDTTTRKKHIGDNYYQDAMQVTTDWSLSINQLK